MEWNGFYSGVFKIVCYFKSKVFDMMFVFRVTVTMLGNDIFFSQTCFILPFIIYFYSISDPSSERDVVNEVAEKERMWVMRCRNSAVAVSFAWIAWILFVQVIFTDSLPSSLYVRDPNSFAATGW